jgi:hypothetical protein
MAQKMSSQKPIKTIDASMIAPCGMNCALCAAYQFKTHDINRHGFHRKYCPGCIPRGQGCLHMGDVCEKLKNGTVRFCFECPDYPCKRLKALDKRYRTKYHMSMIENLETIRTDGLDAFLDRQEKSWACPTCGQAICCHYGLCLVCDLEKVKTNRRYRWNEQDKT